MSELYLSLYKNQAEAAGNILGHYRLDRNYSFSTDIDAGFGQGSFELGFKRVSDLSQIFEMLPETHAVVYDRFGERVYEGRVNRAERLRDTMVLIDTDGYIIHGEEKIHGLIYTSPTYASDVIADTIQLAQQVPVGGGNYVWDQGDAGVYATDVDLGNFDFTGDVKLSDVISKMASMGYKATDVRRMHFQVWDGRLCFYVPDPGGEDRIDWFVNSDQLITEPSISLANDELFNKIYALYDDPNAGPTLTTAVEDEISQDMYARVKEGVINLGQLPAVIAPALQKLFLKDHAYQAYNVRLEIAGFIRNFHSGRKMFPFHVRAGDNVALAQGSVDIGALHLGISYPSPSDPRYRGPQDIVGVILQTQYSSDGRLSVDFGIRPAGYDIIIERLGLVANAS